jgi:RNA methyltransferase, TrmH family
MFPLSKLNELSPRTRQRKIARILQGIEVEAAGGRAPDLRYLAGILPHIETGMPAAMVAAAAALSAALVGPHDAAALIRGVNAVRHAMLSTLQAEPAEWDLVNASTGQLDRSARAALPMAVYLEDVRSPFNVGSIFRTAEAFGAQQILLSPRTPLPSHPRAIRTSLGAQSVLPWVRAELSAAEALGGVFALELGGTAIDRFAFPRSGVVLVGSEELGLSPEALRVADGQSGRVSIPLGGAKRSLNVSVAFGILMHAWRSALTSGSTEPPLP